MKIVIAGGGTAGWLAAYILCKSQPKQHLITVIESSKIGIIGAGEGSTGLLVQLMNGNFFESGTDARTFLDKVDGTNKLGIRHTNWTGDGSSYFAPLDGSITGHLINDFVFQYGLAKLKKDEIYKTSEIGQAYFNNVSPSIQGFHFDGKKVGEYLKELCKKDGVNHIDSEISDVNIDDRGSITSLNLSDGYPIKGDFFIDCTGFARLLSKKLGVGWVSYKKHLPVDTAMPFLLDYTDKDKVIVPQTEATALSAGWMWNIPLKTRRGCGYVFDSSYISREDAQKEVENLLGRKINPIKFINFESGRSEVFWKNNCLSLGLAAAFAEPLEATSIHTTIVQLLTFSNEFLSKSVSTTINKENQDSYNSKIAKLYDITLDFLVIHYQGGRTDSEFWKYINTGKTLTSNAKSVLERTKTRVLGNLEFEGIFGTPYGPLWNWIFSGLGIITADQAENQLKQQNLYKVAEERYNNFTREFSQYANTLPTWDRL
jgi:hypothetical protein